MFASIKDLLSGLQAEHDALQAFVATLESERQALLNGEVERLLTLADDKTRSVQAISKLAEQRRQYAVAHGMDIKSGGMTVWLESQAADALPLWQSVQQLNAQLQELNRVNGELIQTRLLHNQQALAVLHQAANNASTLYGPDGQQDSRPISGRTLGIV